MSSEVRWDLIDKIPDDMLIHSADHTEGQWTWPQWRGALGHPYAQGHGFCQKCGAGGPCELMAFFDAVTMSVVRELDKMGALMPLHDVPRETSRGEPCVPVNCESTTSST